MSFSAREARGRERFGLVWLDREPQEGLCLPFAWGHAPLENCSKVDRGIVGPRREPYSPRGFGFRARAKMLRENFGVAKAQAGNHDTPFACW